jgi:hypothetical protein
MLRAPTFVRRFPDHPPLSRVPEPMMARILVPLLVWISFAACAEGGGGLARVDGRARLDTAAGFRLGMLLPEARAAAAAQGEELRCTLATTDRERGAYPDSVWREMTESEVCEPVSSYAYQLRLHRGSLRNIEVSLSDDWDFIPVDTLVGRLSRGYGKPRKRMTYSTGGGRAAELIWWSRKNDPGIMSLTCPDGAGAGQCTQDFHLRDPAEEEP